MTTAEIRRTNLLHQIRLIGSAAELSRRVPGIKASYLSQILTRAPTPAGTPRGMGDEIARRIEQALDLPRGWMDVPHEDILPTGHAVTEAPAAYHAATREVRVYPLISWVQAGDWTDLATDGLPAAAAQEWHPCAVRCGPRTYVLRVQGHSMEPRFTEGELIFVDPDAEARHGSFVVVRLDDAHQATFKQLIIEGGRRYLRPLNERWPDPIIEINGHATLCGVVIFQGRPV